MRKPHQQCFTAPLRSAFTTTIIPITIIPMAAQTTNTISPNTLYRFFFSKRPPIYLRHLISTLCVLLMPIGVQADLCDSLSRVTQHATQPISSNFGSGLSISQIQGTGHESPYIGKNRTTTGIVTGFDSQRGRMAGVYIEMPHPNSGITPHQKSRPKASRGLYIYMGRKRAKELPTLKVGSLIAVSGKVSEYHGSTQLMAEKIALCAGQGQLPPAALLDGAPLESFEHMRVRLQTSSILSMDTLLRFGDISVSNSAGQNLYLDDNNFDRLTLRTAANNMLVQQYFKRFDQNTVRSQDEVKDIAGILTYRYKQYRILLSQQPTIVSHNPRPKPLPAPGNSTIRLAVINLYNYFNGKPQTTSRLRSDSAELASLYPMDFSKQHRGANNAAAFNIQNKKVLHAWDYLKPDIVLLSELENDQPPHTALQTLLASLNQSFPPAHWTAAEPANASTTSGDIRNAIVYNANRVRPRGDAKSLPLHPHKKSNSFTRHRNVIVQSFMLDTRALRLGVVHLKSRGGCKGQQTPCWEQARLKAIDALITQLSQQTEPGLPTIIAGDFNTLPNEKPLRKLGEAGFTPMLKTPQAYSYRYRGKPLLLDHAFLRVPNDRPHALTPIKYAKKYSEKISTHVIKLSSDEAPFLHPTHRDHDLFQQLHSALNNSALNESELNQIALTKSTTVGPFRFSDHDPLVIDVPLNTFEHND